MILDGKKVAKGIHQKIKAAVAQLSFKPGLAAVLVGNNPASKLYVDIKRRTCDEVGIHAELTHLPEETTEAELIAVIKKLNARSDIHAILLQLPLPKHIKKENIFAVMDPKKDVDGFTAENLGKLFRGDENCVPCTPRGIIRLLNAYDIPIAGKHAVVIGRSLLVGRPVALMLLNRNATVTVCHSKTNNLTEHTKQADILVVAAGRAGLVIKDMIKPGAVVVDVGINKQGQGIVGDVDYSQVQEIASAITPVPGGVGPMTVAMLLENTLTLARLQ